MQDSASDLPDEPVTPQVDLSSISVSNDDPRFKTAQITAVPNLIPTAYIARGEDDALWQLWWCSGTNTREWRPLPKLDDAFKEYGGTFAP